MRIGIMGGTFDPIHYGHLNSAEEIAEIFKLDRVIFIPTFIPPHKKKEKITGVYHRLMMTMLATLGNPRFTVSTIEIERDGYSYTIDTINELRNRFRKGTAKDNFYFITGIDAFKDIFTWKDADRLLKNCDFIVSTRPGYRTDDLFNMLNDTAAKKYKNIKFRMDRKNPFVKSPRLYIIGSKHFIYPVETTALDISSTDIRSRIKKGMTVKYLLSESVEEYINKNGLYE
jgi:nicotinate-nucleotide adenylyltransferase